MSELIESLDPRGVATLTMNRPERHNTFDDVLIAQMDESLRRLEASPDVRAIVIGGNGRSFSAGADIGWLKRMSTAPFEENMADAVALAELLHRLYRLSKPTIALVHGAAYGGGVGIAACCDIVLASSRASFCLSEVKLGVIPAVISPFIIRAIGARQARRFVLTAEVIFAEAAKEIGLVHEVVPEAQLPSAREKIVDALLRGAPGAQAEAKALMLLCEDRAIGDDLVQDTAQWIAARRASAEGREGLNAFLEKRPPSWHVVWGS